MGFQPVAVVDKTVHQYKIYNFIQQEKQYSKQFKTQNTENRQQTHKTGKQNKNKFKK
jgi:hypothetical protein